MSKQLLLDVSAVLRSLIQSTPSQPGSHDDQAQEIQSSSIQFSICTFDAEMCLAASWSVLLRDCRARSSSSLGFYFLCRELPLKLS